MKLYTILSALAIYGSMLPSPPAYAQPAPAAICWPAASGAACVAIGALNPAPANIASLPECAAPLAPVCAFHGIGLPALTPAPKTCTGLTDDEAREIVELGYKLDKTHRTVSGLEARLAKDRSDAAATAAADRAAQGAGKKSTSAPYHKCKMCAVDHVKQTAYVPALQARMAQLAAKCK